jgi:hypothetical protein
MVHPQVADGGDGLQIWRVAVNILNKQSCTADRGWSSSLGFGRGGGLTTPTIKHLICYKIYTTALDQDGFFGKMTQAPKNGYQIWHLESEESLQDRLIEDSSEGYGEV